MGIVLFRSFTFLWDAANLPQGGEASIHRKDKLLGKGSIGGKCVAECCKHHLLSMCYYHIFLFEERWGVSIKVLFIFIFSLQITTHKCMFHTDYFSTSENRQVQFWLFHVHKYYHHFTPKISNIPK